jgi:uncharacterized protein
MQYNVAGLLKAPTGDARRVEVDELVVIDDLEVRLVAPVRGEVALIREPDGVLASGRFRTRAAMACARCLAPVEQDLAFELTESFRPTVYIPGGPVVSVDPDADPATLIDELHVLDLREVIRQAIELAVPLHPLCRPDCRGLCVQCGRDLNDDACTCTDEPDPRWDELRALLEAAQGANEEGGVDATAPHA